MRIKPACACVFFLWIVLGNCSSLQGLSHALRRMLALPVVPGTNPPAEWKRAKTVQDMEPIIKENLEPELAFWRNRHTLTMDHFMRVVEHIQAHMNMDIYKVILLTNNSVRYPFNKGKDKSVCEEPCNGRLDFAMKELMRHAQRKGLSLPNSLFVFSTDDNTGHSCSAAEPLAAPILGYMKFLGDCEISVPQFTGFDDPVPRLFNVPWEKKKDTAFFRGTAYCCGYKHEFQPCSRTYLAHLTYFHNKSDDLDVGLISGWGVGNPDELKNPAHVSSHGAMPKYPVFPLPDHALYRYLLHLDGISGSTRLGQLMYTNSLIIKQASPFVEYFSRSLKPWVHYVPFWEKHEEDIFNVLEDLRKKAAGGRESLEKLLGIIEASQRFAVAYMGPTARTLYWIAALEGYNSLFGNMTAMVELVDKRMREKGAAW